MTQAIEGCTGQQPVGGEGLIPFRQIEVAGHDGGGGLVALGNEFVQILIGRRSQRLEAEVVDDQQARRGPCWRACVRRCRLRGRHAGSPSSSRRW